MGGILRLGLIRRYLNLRADMLRKSGGRIVLKRMVGVETLHYSRAWVLDFFLRDGGESKYISLVLVVERPQG